MVMGFLPLVFAVEKRALLHMTDLTARDAIQLMDNPTYPRPRHTATAVPQKPEWRHKRAEIVMSNQMADLGKRP